MLSLYNILTIAHYEFKVLLRSWFFRIFSLLALAVLVSLNYGVFAFKYSPWMVRGISSGIPYLNIILLNVVQAVIGVFMASDFLKYDRKLDTTDVIYMRSMTNADYVLGKTLGVLVVFGGFNIVVLIISLVFNVFFTDVPVVPVVYVLYPLLISLPTLLFIFGLSFLLMVIIRNQAVTFVVLLGYIAVTMFFLGHKFHYLFDYMAFSVPLMYSDFVGFGNVTPLLIHRGIYLLMGIGFIFTTILMLRRLPQSRIMNYVSLVLAVCSITGALMLGDIYLARLSSGKTLREDMASLNKEIFRTPVVSLNSCDIDLTHSGDEISVKAHLVFTNRTQNAIDRCVFSLNPGFEVTKVTSNGQDIPHTRNLHILTVESPQSLEPGAIDSLTVFYYGKVSEEACYLDVDEEIRETNFRILFFAIDKRYGFITPEYVLLIPENLWYPVAGVPYGAAYPELQARDFINFTLRVKTADNLTAVSQGACVVKDTGEFHFTPEVPMPQLSLAIGRYEKRTVTVDDMDYSLYILEGHDYFSEYFTDIGEKLNEIISRSRRDFEFKLGLDYPYKRLSLVETPIQFFTYPRLWTVSMETVQPEIMLLPEKGITLNSADFKINIVRMKRMSQRGQRVMTPEEMQENMAGRFFSTFLSDASSHFRFVRLRTGITNFALPNYTGNYSVFPAFYTYSHNFSSDKWPIFNVALEYYLNTKIENQRPSFARFMIGLSDEEKANYALMKKSLTEILADPEKDEDVYNVLAVKSKYLFAFIKSELGSETLSEFLNGFLDSHAFSDCKAEDFVNELKEGFGLDLEPYFDSWLHGKQLPAFIVADVSGFEFFDWESTRYQVTFKVTNLEPVDGLISVNFRTGERGGSMGRGGGFSFSRRQEEEDTEKIYSIEAGQTKEIGIILDESPRVMIVNTYISQNLPSVFEQWFEKLESNDDMETFEGDRISDRPITLAEAGEIIVDNEDPGFEIHSISSESFLKKMLNRNKDEDEDDYTGLRFWRPPSNWRATTSDNFYGRIRHSAHYIKAGDGKNRVSWKAEVPQSGNYSVYYYTSEIRAPGMRRRRDRNRVSYLDEFHLFVHHDDGVDEIKLDAAQPQVGWNLLGTYYFSQGESRVELTDLSKGRVVYADAVKWVKQK